MSLLLAAGLCPPWELSVVRAAAEASGVRLQEVDMLPAPLDKAFRALSSRVAPVLLARDGRTLVFGGDAVADYLLKLKPSSSKAGLTTLAQLKHEMSAAPPAQKRARTDLRDPLQVLGPMFRDACLRAFPAFEQELLALPAISEVALSARDETDYQFNGCMAIFSKLKGKPGFEAKTPNEVAVRVVAQLPPASEVAWLAQSIQVVKNLFYVNVVVSPQLLNERVSTHAHVDHAAGERLPAPLGKKERVLIDFSSPNIAKEMHVGHLRSTIIGDSLARVLEFMGHTVLRVNHVGDWGTQFGMLLQLLAEDQEHPDTLQYLAGMSLGDLTRLYQRAKQRFSEDAAFADRARAMVVKLQSGTDPHARAVWAQLVEVSKRGFDDVYQRLGVGFPFTGPGTGYCGESFYQDKIPQVIKEMHQDKKLARTEDGALLIFTGLARAINQGPDGKKSEVPLFLCKKDGGFGYDSTDLAAVRFRLKELSCDRILYVTDAGQELHFEMVFEAARQAGWITEGKRLEHVKFGVVTQPGGGKFRTREGDTVTLVSLLDEARDRMLTSLQSRLASGDTTTRVDPSASLPVMAATIGYAAVKYADLRNSREKDYEFDMDRMLSPDGDTAVYLLYAYARVSSVVDKATAAAGGVGVAAVVQYDVSSASLKERRIALRVSRFGETLSQVEQSLAPHVLCSYLYQLSYETATFLTDDRERVLDAGQLEPKRGMQRLVLVKAVKATLFEGLGLLGIVPIERM